MTTRGSITKERNQGRAMRAIRWVVGLLGELLITLGLLLLLFVAWQLWWTDVTANKEQASTVQALERGFAGGGGGGGGGGVGVGGGGGGTAEPLANLNNVRFGQAFAILRIPRFGADYARPVLQGTDHDTLNKGVGHYPETVMPGLIGNFSVAGHRTTYGRPFHNIDLLAKGDVIIVETKVSYIVYAVDRHVIVTPSHVEVVAPVPQRPGIRPVEAWMTMTSCHPKFSASHRYVVFAKLVNTFPRAGGLPASFTAVPSGEVA